MKKKIVLIVLFIFPIVAYLIFASAKHNSLFLPTISENNKELPKEWLSNNQEIVVLQNKITIMGFLGSKVLESKGYLFNLNQKIYNKYFGFNDFQIVMIVSKGQEEAVKQVINDLEPLTEDMKGWKFVFAAPEEIQAYYDSFKLVGKLDASQNTPAVFIIDKDLKHRGRKGTDLRGQKEFKESYNTISPSELHNEMTDDVKIILREYRLALKRNKEKLYINEK